MMTAFHDPVFFTLSCTALGLIVGSFLNVVILRLPKMMELSWRRECCELLEQPVSDEPSPDTVLPRLPVPGLWHPYQALAKHTGHQLAHIAGPMRAVRYAHLGALPRLSSWSPDCYQAWPPGSLVLVPEAMSALVLIWVLIALTGIDMDTQLLPDSMTLPLLWLGLGVNLFAVWTPLSSAVMGAMLGYGSLWGVYWLFKLVTGKEGMGYGDFKLLGALGAWFGWQAVPLMILLSSFVGAALGIAILIARRQGRDTPMPFGPYWPGPVC